MPETLAQRRQWYAHFPQGSAEFLVITRFLMLMLMAAPMIVLGSQLPFIVVGLSFMIWLDYVLVLWWCVQTADDLMMLETDSMVSAEDARRTRVRTGVVAALPSIFAFLLLAPWGSVAFEFEATRHKVMLLLRPILLVAFVVSVYFAQQALMRLRLGTPKGVFSFLIPILHGIAMQRAFATLQQRVGALLAGVGQTVPEKASASLLLANIAWVLLVLIWAPVVLKGLEHLPSVMQTILPLCGTAAAALFATAQLAAIESAQRAFVQLIRRV